MKDIALKIVRFLILVFLLSVSAGCQTVTGDAENDFAAPVTASAGDVVPIKREVLGNGPVRVEILLPASGDARLREIAKEMRNGATLAARDLGADQITVTFDAIAKAPQPSASKSDPTQGSNFLVLLGEESALSAYDAITVPSVALVANDVKRPAGIFAFTSSESDSLIAGINHAVGEKPGPVALIVPPDFSIENIDRIQSRLGADNPLNVINYTADETAAQVAKRAIEAEKSTRVFAFAGNDQKIEFLVKSIHALKVANKDFLIVGNMSWGAGLLGASVMEGAIVATIDTSASQLIQQAYVEKFQQAPTLNALYGYDVIGVISGILRAKGATGLTHAALNDPIGFRGVTGAFRFATNGAVERLYAIQKISAGKFVQISEAGAGF